jgi:hypothetical protein
MATYLKAQSAMEYLMTYGWAILIIAVVLGSLFALGIFNSSSLLGNACIASSGYLCQKPVYNHANANIIVTLGQNTGTNWVTANFVFVPQGTPVVAGIPTSLVQTGISVWGNTPGNGAGGPVTIGNSFISGGTIPITLPTNGVTQPVTVGQAATGTIWAEYQTTASGAYQYAQIATINIKAT